MGRWVAGIALLVAPLGATAFADGEPFFELVARYTRSRDAPPVTRHREEGLRYVFIAGYANEGIPRYFRDNQAELKRLGIPSLRLFPPSALSVAEGAEWLYRRLERIPGRFVLVGHSMGAARTLAMALAHPEIIVERTEAALLLQGPIVGTPLVRLFRDHPPTSSLRRWERVSVDLQRDVAHYFDPHWHGLSSCSREAMTALLEPYLRAGVPDEVSRKLWFVRSSEDLRRQSAAVRGTGRWMAPYGPNDGMILLADQWHPGVGTVLATLTADHTALVTGVPVHAGGKALRLGFTKALVDWVERRETLSSLPCPVAVAR